MRWLVVLVLTLAGCDYVFNLHRPLPDAALIDADIGCMTDDACVAGGVRGTCSCGQCSYPDATCPVSALRWADDAQGAMSNACIAAIDTIDSKVFHTCATMTDGTGWCWGSNSTGQLGAGTTAASAALPVRVRSSAGVVHDLVEIRTGGSTTCARRTDGHVVCWGGNEFGQLGAGLALGQAASDPVEVQTDLGPLAEVTQLTVGYTHACAIAGTNPEQRLYCWGNNSKGQIGAPVTTTTSNVAVQVGIKGGDLRQIMAGGEHTCVAMIPLGNTESSTYCWGRTADGRLGNNALAIDTAEPSPQEVLWNNTPPTFPAVIAIAAGNRFTCSIKNPDFDFYCWGTNTNGEIGDGSRNTARIATRTTGTTGQARSLIAAGDHHACGTILDDVWCWGSDNHGQLGNGGVTTADQLVPQSILQNNPHRALAAGHEHTCALDSARRLRCWGANSFGQLGIGDTVDQPVPVEIPKTAFCPGPMP